MNIYVCPKKKYLSEFGFVQISEELLKDTTKFWRTSSNDFTSTMSAFEVKYILILILF